MSLYNEDELVPPSWIDQEFFEKVLRQYENKEDIKITQIDMKPASLKGDHYASVMFRCKLSYLIAPDSVIKQKSLILKTLPTDEGPKRDMLKDSKLFETEIGMYTEALPKIEKILEESGEPTKLAAEIVYHSLEPHKVLIFEDLCEAGFTTIRGRYLNEQEIKLVYSKIAKLHAVSYMLGQSELPEIVTRFDEGMCSSSAIMGMDFMAAGIKNFVKLLEEHEEFKVYLEKVRNMEPEMLQKSTDLFKAYKLENDLKDIFVLNHGDFHMKNLMFKLNEKEEMEDLIMVDYQVSCYAPSTVDMVYAEYMILSPEYRLRRNEFMQYYFEEFIRVLRKIGYEAPVPLYSEFQIANLKYRHFTLFLLSTVLPFVRLIMVPSADELKDVDTAKLIEDPAMGIIAYQSSEFVAELSNLLPQLLKRGYLD